MGSTLQQIASRAAAAPGEVAARRARLAADMRAEGSPDALVDRLATDETAARMLKYERQCKAAIMGMFAGSL